MDPYDYVEQQWRYRIESIQILLLDASENIIPNMFGCVACPGFSIFVRYPMEFVDIDASKNFHKFKSQSFNCR